MFFPELSEIRSDDPTSDLLAHKRLRIGESPIEHRRICRIRNKVIPILWPAYAQQFEATKQLQFDMKGVLFEIYALLDKLRPAMSPHLTETQDVQEFFSENYVKKQIATLDRKLEALKSFKTGKLSRHGIFQNPALDKALRKIRELERQLQIISQSKARTDQQGCTNFRSSGANKSFARYLYGFRLANEKPVFHKHGKRARDESESDHSENHNFLDFESTYVHTQRRPTKKARRRLFTFNDYESEIMDTTYWS